MIYHIILFTSRRRHTRWPRDWSSDVCSSDLVLIPARNSGHDRWIRPRKFQLRDNPARPHGRSPCPAYRPKPEIGRASCRERVQISKGAVLVENTKKEIK